ncbi:hypothetical protein GM658_08585 [Pseudoduganella eburnea]|uniref:Uncharacterized protein n=1 Tax=Massilia eburnea TaxID=1776165 RepID=A0A6L6QET7_9BURK|nr:hypothetical protein [Massilia eburnea]MTW10661.1 hypothetical protein [Massilia eburnea]
MKTVAVTPPFRANCHVFPLQNRLLQRLTDRENCSGFCRPKNKLDIETGMKNPEKVISLAIAVSLTWVQSNTS